MSHATTLRSARGGSATAVSGEADAEALAERLAACLAPAGGWYVNHNSTAEAFVVFAGRVFRSPRGQDPRGRAEGRRQARAHARSLGIPEGQLDWRN